MLDLDVSPPTMPDFWIAVTTFIDFLFATAEGHEAMLSSTEQC